MTIVNQKEIQKKAKAYTATGKFENERLAIFEVTNGDPEKQYAVCIYKPTDDHDYYAVCNCDWGRHQPGNGASSCKHALTAYAELFGKPVYAWRTLEEAKKQRRPMYNIGNGTFLTVG